MTSADIWTFIWRGTALAQNKLSECQSAAEEGWLSGAVGAFLAWIASRYEELQMGLRQRTIELRGCAYPGPHHNRLPAALAELQSGWEIWLQEFWSGS